jgi:hypothetical protein
MTPEERKLLITTASALYIANTLPPGTPLLTLGRELRAAIENIDPSASFDPAPYYQEVPRPELKKQSLTDKILGIIR